MSNEDETSMAGSAWPRVPNLADEPTLEKAIRTTRGLGISAKQAQETEVAFWRGRCEETQELLDRALAQVAERDAQLRGQDLTISHLHGQVAALKDVFAMGQQAAARALYGPQIGAVTQEFELQGLEDVPPRREEPALLGVQQRVAEQLKSAGIDTKSLCGYEWDDDGPCDHACGVVNPLHLGDHVCEQGCGAMCSQQQAERRGQELTISHLHGQVAALERVFAMGQQAAARAMFGPQGARAATQEFELQGLDDVPPRREEPALAGVQQRVVDQLKSAGIDTKSLCHYEWDSDDDRGCASHACGIVNPLHLGDHECEQDCSAKCSQQEAERIEEAKQRADSDG